MPPGVGYPTRPSGTTGQDLQRLQNSGNPQPSGTSAPLDLLGTGSPPPGSPQPLTSAPSTPGIPTAMPGVDEGITGPSSIQQGNPELSPSTNAIIEGIKAGDPESIQMLDQLMKMIEGQGQDQDQGLGPVQ